MSYFGSIDARMSASDKELPVQYLKLKTLIPEINQKLKEAKSAKEKGDLLRGIETVQVWLNLKYKFARRPWTTVVSVAISLYFNFQLKSPKGFTRRSYSCNGKKKS